MTAMGAFDSSNTVSLGGPTWNGTTHDDFTHSTTDESITVVAGPPNVISNIDTLLWYVVAPVLLVFGTFGNMMTVVVMRGMRASPSTACLSLYFTALALSDQCKLVTFLMFMGVDRTVSWPPSLFRFDILCIVPKFTWCTCAMTSAWFLVAMTYQRVTAVIAPHRVGILCSVRTGKTVIVIIIIFACALNLHHVFTWCYWPEFRQCQYKEKYMYYLDVFEWIDLSGASMFPFVFLSTGNCILVWQVIRSMRLSQKMRGNVDQKTSSESDKVQSMSITLILTSAIFLVLTVPICIWDLFTQKSFEDSFSPMLQLADTVINLMVASAFAYNFYLYLLSGNKFRQEVKRILC